MSRRHDDREAEIHLDKEDRLAEHRRQRRVARQALGVDPEEAVLADGHAHLHSHRSEKPMDPLAARRQRRHWKLPFWKRRVTVRHQQNESLRALAVD